MLKNILRTLSMTLIILTAIEGECLKNTTFKSACPFQNIVLLTFDNINFNSSKCNKIVNKAHFKYPPKINILNANEVITLNIKVILIMSKYLFV